MTSRINRLSPEYIQAIEGIKSLERKFRNKIVLSKSAAENNDNLSAQFHYNSAILIYAEICESFRLFNMREAPFNQFSFEKWQRDTTKDLELELNNWQEIVPSKVAT